MVRQDKNAHNTTKSSTTAIKTSGAITARLEQPKIAEENDQQNNFRRMFEAHKEEVRNFLKEMEDNTHKIGRYQQMP